MAAVPLVLEEVVSAAETRSIGSDLVEAAVADFFDDNDFFDDFFVFFGSSHP